MTTPISEPSRRDFEEIIDRRIRATTRLAFDNNSFINGLFKKSGINPHIDIKGRQDLVRAARKGVRINGADIPKCYADYIETIPTVEVWSSGSSSKSKKILRSRDEIARINDGQARVYASAGIKDGQRVLTFPGANPYGSSQSAVEGLKNINVRSLHFSIPPIIRYIPDVEKATLAKRLIDVIREFDPHCVRSGAWHAGWLPKFLGAYGFDRSMLHVNALIFGGDPTTSEDRKRIGSYWNAEPFEVYASTEVSLIGFECIAHRGLHMNESNVFTSAIDPESGEEVATGEKGVDMVTPLFDENALPATLLINYSHGDHIKIFSEKCNCSLEKFTLMDHPTRDTRKKPIAAFDFEPKVNRSLFRRVVQKIRRAQS